MAVGGWDPPPQKIECFLTIVTNVTGSPAHVGLTQVSAADSGACRYTPNAAWGIIVLGPALNHMVGYTSNCQAPGHCNLVA